MRVNVTGRARIFAKEQNGFTKYATSFGKKNQEGGYDNGWLFVRFRKGVTVKDRTDIDIKEAWATFDQYEKDGKTVTVWGIFVNDFEELLDHSEYEATKGFSQLQNEDIPF